MSDGPGGLTLVATPIGNLGDLTPRAAQALATADIWIVEDTRVSGKLASHLGVRAHMRVLNDHTPDSSISRYVDEIASGKRAAMLSDGGSPVVSDPGAKLADLCHERGIAVTVTPGPSAVTAALALSGFFAQRFVFLGFLGRKPGAIRSELEPWARSPLTIVLFESPHRVGSLLKVAGEALGPRRYAICREISKVHEQVYRDKLPTIPSEELLARKGELTVVIEGLRRGLNEL